MLEKERSREVWRAADRALLAMSQGVGETDDSLHFKLLHRLDYLIPFVQSEVTRLEAERAQVLLEKLESSE
jgi:hypothetical protein